MMMDDDVDIDVNDDDDDGQSRTGMSCTTYKMLLYIDST